MALIYSCCFWFSLRLGGILIAIFSMLQGLVILGVCCVAYSNATTVKDSIKALINSMDLIYIRTQLENVQEDPEKYLSIGVCLTCIYIFLCFLYAYGAYMFKNIFMTAYILVELLRLIFLTFGITTWLLILKENTMDIGIHIGTSVAGSFLLLGMFYLWLCAVNLPILINETERDQQAATIQRLQQMLEMTSKQGFRTKGIATLENDANFCNPSFAAARYRNKTFKPMLENGSLNSRQFYLSHLY